MNMIVQENIAMNMPTAGAVPITAARQGSGGIDETVMSIVIPRCPKVWITPTESFAVFSAFAV